MGVKTVVLQFVDAINHADVDRLAGLMTDGHVFVDSDGSKIIGRKPARDAWSQYFSIMADYRIDTEDIFCSGNRVAVIGMASGRYATGANTPVTNLWSVPAAWRAVVDRNRVSCWQVFVNPEPILLAAKGAR